MGGWHNLALKSNGSLVGWGYNGDGQTDVPEGNDFVEIGSGSYHSLAIAATQPDLAVTEPNGGENLLAGKTYTISWQSQGYITEVLIEYSSNNGSDWTEVASDVNNTGSYNWLVPSVDSNECVVRISSARYWSVSDTSDAPFTTYICKLDYDLNGDCFVDMFDFAFIASEWLKCGNKFDPNCKGYEP